MRSEKRKMRDIRDPDLSGRGVIVFCCLLGTYGLLAICSCNESLQPRLNRDTSREVGIKSGLVSPDLIGEAVRIVEAALADADPQIRVNAIEVVAATRRVELMPKVRRLLRDEFVPVRFAAALAVRIAAAYALVRLGHLDSFGLIRKAIISKDQVVRANAALILGKSGDARQLKLLNWALSDRDSSDKVRFQVAEAMAMLGDEQVYPKLWAMLISAYADDRVMGIKAMGALGTELAKNALITMLDDKVLEVRLVAAGQLGALGSSLGESEVLDVFRRNLTAGMDADGLERVHVFTALAVGQIRTAAVTEFLPKLLKNQSKRVRIAVAKAVLQCAK